MKFEHKCCSAISQGPLQQYPNMLHLGQVQQVLNYTSWKKTSRLTPLPPLLHQLTIKTFCCSGPVVQGFPHPHAVLGSSRLPPFHNYKCDKKANIFTTFHCRRHILHSHLEDGACTDHPKSAIFNSPFEPSSKFSGLMSRWITFFEWQYDRASASSVTYCI